MQERPTGFLQGRVAVCTFWNLRSAIAPSMKIYPMTDRLRSGVDFFLSPLCFSLGSRFFNPLLSDGKCIEI